jgi:DNA polymerase delta subunit 1
MCCARRAPSPDARPLRALLPAPRTPARACRPVAQSNFELPGHQYGYTFQTFESNFPFVLRFMVDVGLQGCAWASAPAGSYRVRPWVPRDGAQLGLTSTCQIELDVHWSSLVAHAPEGEWQKVAPFSILSVDIECAGRVGVFPEPEHDPVIQIANHVTVHGESTPKLRCILTLNHCAPIADAEVGAERAGTRAGMRVGARAAVVRVAAARRGKRRGRPRSPRLSPPLLPRPPPSSVP